MEKRKVQRTGGSSLTVTLPKRWASEAGLENGDEVVFSPQSTGALLVKKAGTAAARREVVVIDGLSPQAALRGLIALYVADAEEIEVRASVPSAAMRDMVRRHARMLVGFEIVEETGSGVVMKNILDADKFPVAAAVEKMFLVAGAMLEDAVAALEKSDRRLAEDVASRDAEVDKLYLAVMRRFHSMLLDRTSEEEAGIGRLDSAFYANVASQVERIADHAVKIAGVAASKKGKHVASRRVALAMRSASSMLEDARAMALGIDATLANAVLDRHEADERKVRPGREVPPRDASEAIALDSLARVRGYVMNVAEATIDQAALALTRLPERRTLERV